MFKKVLLLGVLPAILVSAALLVITGSAKEGQYSTATTNAQESARELEIAPALLPGTTMLLPGTATRLPASATRPPASATLAATRQRRAVTGTATPPPAATATIEVIQLPRTAENWKDWPVEPQVSDEMRRLYQAGLAQGTNPRAFSILGDCQSEPPVFLGIYDSDPNAYLDLPSHLQETVRQFAGSFNRYSPTVKDASTAGALLWAEWNDNRDRQCRPGETPIDCELRVHRPSIVLIHIGTHWEARNKHYLELLIQKIEEAGAVPVLATKADNRELDERINREMAELAVEQNLPLWNFWGTLKTFPNHGLVQNSDMYLNGVSIEIHRRSALEALDLLWRELNQ